MQDETGIIAALHPAGWQMLTEIYDEVCAHQGPFSEYKGGSPNPDGTLAMGYVQGAPVVDKTMRFFYENSLIIPFDWVKWDEGRAIFNREGEDKFSDVSLEDVLKLFTAIIRNDRFNEGAFAALFESGDARLLLKRLLEFKPN